MNGKAALHWFRFYSEMPWQWDERGEALVDPSGTTILLFDELLVLAQALAPGGLPPIGALTMLCAACRDTWPEQAPGIFARFARHVGSPSRQEREPEQEPLPDRVRAKLDLIAALPRERRATTSAKLALAVIMRDRGATPPEDRADPEDEHRIVRLGIGANAMIDARELRRIAEDGLSADDRAPYISMVILDEHRELLDYLDRSLIPPTPATQELVERTGLQDLPGPAPLTAGAVRALLAGLADDDELGGLAALTARLLAAVHLPRPLAASDELAVDGVSDLSNRGSPDRLLLSELANDGLVLATRVALGEALYLRREAPPQSPPHARTILIDTGIRLWGVARVFATALALALAASGPRGARSRAWRTVVPAADGARIAGAELGTRAGLVDQLAVLGLEPQPGAALAAWRATWDGDGDEAVLITHAAAFADPALRAALAALPPLHVATVDAQGRYRLHALAGGGSALVQEAELDLALLHAQQERAQVVALRPPSAGVPALYGQDPCPLLLPHLPHAERLVAAPGGEVLTLTRDGRLMLWPVAGVAARQLTDQVPEGALLWLGWGADPALVHALLRCRGDATPVLVTAPTRGGVARCARLRPSRFQPFRFVPQGGTLLGIGARGAAAYSLNDGRLAGELAWPDDVAPRAGRFVSSRTGKLEYAWRALGWDGANLQLHALRKHQDGLTWFDRPDQAGPWCMSPAGRFCDLVGENAYELPKPRHHYHFLGVGTDGARVLVANDGACTLVDLAARAYRPLAKDVVMGDTEDSRTTLSQRRRKDVTGILCSPLRNDLLDRAGLLLPQVACIFRQDRRICILTGGRDQWLLDADGPLPAWKRLPTRRDDQAGFLDFAALAGADPRWRLRQAKSGAGEFLVDARGLLHCRHPGRAEVGIALLEGPTAVWCADGRAIGPPEFLAPGLGPLPPADARALLDAYVGDLP